jgi:hypothetical protein
VGTTSGITDPAPITHDLKPQRYRGLRCIRFVRHQWISKRIPPQALVPRRHASPHADYQAHGEIAASPCLNGLPEQIEFPSVEPHSRAGSATVHNDVLNNFLLHLGPINGAPTLGLSRRSDAQLAIAARRQAFKLRLSSLPVAPDTSIAN